MNKFILSILGLSKKNHVTEQDFVDASHDMIHRVSQFMGFIIVALLISIICIQMNRLV